MSCQTYVEILELKEKLLGFAEVEAEKEMMKQILKRMKDTQNSEEETMPVVMVPTVDVLDSVTIQLNNEVGRVPSNLGVR
ncbi:3494_t:CDS:2 [Acaulospora morrowiae]|uniref:3494_t:CDS:1 n=1 Tax=Acaulospora morrowiae TaxID=94023 RepID=A0A9N9N853_9GLOM|nr:3494_t:CDS:2 [Acaulospora morrowiae]